MTKGRSLHRGRREPRIGTETRRRSVAVAALAAGALVVLPSPVARAAPVAAFTVSPAAPLSGEPVTFTSTSSGGVTSLAWDLDADGQYNDGAGQVAQRAFPTPGRYLVSLQVAGPGGSATQSQWIQVGNRPPIASFSYTPSAPVALDAVMFAAAAHDTDGSIASIGWDFNGDGIFTDATGPVASEAFPAPGAYAVAIQVTDNSGATTITSQGVVVAPRPPTMLEPFPIVRLTTRSTARGVRVLRLGVQAPQGSRVTVRCRGRGCPKRNAVRVARTPQALRFRAVQRRLRAGAMLEVAVTAPGRIGKYTRFRVRRGRPPSRVDLCLPPGGRPTACPGG
jgi:PKD repeat protein